VPVSVAAVVGNISDAIDWIFTTEAVTALGANRYINSDKAKKILGFKNTYPKKGINSMVQYYVRQQSEG
jgi:hypothetical protein